jgi:hypothetical protein
VGAAGFRRGHVLAGQIGATRGRSGQFILYPFPILSVQSPVRVVQLIVAGLHQIAPNCTRLRLKKMKYEELPAPEAFGAAIGLDELGLRELATGTPGGYCFWAMTIVSFWTH